MEGAAYIIKKNPDADLTNKIELLIDQIEKKQGADGYFNIYFTVCEPENRLKCRGLHELYCAGHLFEAAVAYAEATGKERFLKLMEKYADYLYRVFMEERSAAFVTPGHEEIELALVKMYRYTGKKKYLDLAAFFINERGVHPEELDEYCQSHRPVREQTEAVGHSVRAVYLYSAMADLAKELSDDRLKMACEALYSDIVNRKMYITGGIGSCHIGESFSNAYDLPNEEAYTETCAGIGLMFFCHRMLALENKATYADTIERVFYNGVLSGLSLDGKSFFYENPLEITKLNHFSSAYGSRRFPITQRVDCFDCSCCPPNMNRLLAKLGEFIFGINEDTLYINQFASATLSDGSVTCEMVTDYPINGKIMLKAKGVDKIAIRIPSWCINFTTEQEYMMQDGYAIFENSGCLQVEFDMTPFALRSNSKVVKDVGKLCVQAGPVVYCAESVDNCENLHALIIPEHFGYKVTYSDDFDMNVLEIDAFLIDDDEKALYYRAMPEEVLYKPTKVRMIPYRAFANRGESDMLVWFHTR